MSHHFGPPTDLMARGDRLCNEPKFGKAEDSTIFHARFTILPKGDMVCNHCGEHFKTGGTDMRFIKVVENGVQTTCEVIREFGDVRAIVRYEGLYVFADRYSLTEWELSGTPAQQGEEMDALNALVAPGTTTTVTKS